MKSSKRTLGLIAGLLVGLIVGLVGGFSGASYLYDRSFSRAPSERQYADIVGVLTEKIIADRGRIAQDAPLEIKIRKNKAVARYSVSFERSQFVYCPMRSELFRTSGKWAVVAHRTDEPWWWHVANRTVGVK